MTERKVWQLESSSDVKVNQMSLSKITNTGGEKKENTSEYIKLMSIVQFKTKKQKLDFAYKQISREICLLNLLT